MSKMPPKNTEVTTHLWFGKHHVRQLKKKKVANALKSELYP